jgi:hypothetical protein
MSEQQEESCVVCESKGHRTTECPTIPAFKEVLYGQTSDSSNESLGLYGMSNPSVTRGRSFVDDIVVPRSYLGCRIHPSSVTAVHS